MMKPSNHAVKVS